MGFPRQEYWSGLSFPGDLPDPGIKLASPGWQTSSLPLSHQESPLLSVVGVEMNKASFLILLKQNLKFSY